MHMVWDGSDDPMGNVLVKSHELLAIEMAKHAENTLKLGVTTVRDLASPGEVGFAVREAIKNGTILGCNLLISGPGITMTGGHVHEMGIEADGVDEVRKATRYLLKKEVDCIKLMASGGIYSAEGEIPGSPQFTVEEMKAAIEEAHKRGKKVAAHAEGYEGIMNALAAGVDSIEHGNMSTDEVWDKFVEQGTYLVPTLLTMRRTKETAEAGGLPEYIVDKARQMHEGHLKNFNGAVAKGVKIAVGTDGYAPNMPEGSYYDELLLMKELGMTALGVLQAATINAAENLGISKDYGTIEVGKVADLVVVSINPLENINFKGKVAKVLKNGRVIS